MEQAAQNTSGVRKRFVCSVEKNFYTESVDRKKSEGTIEAN